MKIIVVTGKSGSGKTYVSNKLASALNCKALDLDQVSHQTLTLDRTKEFVKTTFGDGVFIGENIDTKSLGKIAFSNPDLLEKLNDFCHQEMLKIIDNEIAETTTEYIILDYLLLPQMKYFDIAHFKVLVKADGHTRKTRIISRDGISPEYYDSRESNSIDFNESDFDFVLENSSSSNIDELISQIKNCKN
jgi:dephospho-CoA kinase